MNKLTEVGFFAGIGGFSLAARMTGRIQTIQHIEIDPRAQRVLKDQFSRVPIHADIKTYSPLYRSANLYTVGFPCTQTSTAGQRTGLAGEDSGLWFEALRCIIKGDPAFVVIENPPGLIDRGLQQVLGGLRMAGYSWEDPTLLSAALLGAPHERQRLFIIAYADSLKWTNRPCEWSDQIRSLVQEKRSSCEWPQFVTGDDGAVARIPPGLDGVPVSVAKGTRGRLSSRIVYGRSVMPDVAQIALERVLTLADCVDLSDY